MVVQMASQWYSLWEVAATVLFSSEGPASFLRFAILPSICEDFFHVPIFRLRIIPAIQFWNFKFIRSLVRLVSKRNKISIIYLHRNEWRHFLIVTVRIDVSIMGGTVPLYWHKRYVWCLGVRLLFRSGTQYSIICPLLVERFGGCFN